MVRGIRGATTTEQDDSDHIIEATTELLQRIVERNEIRIDDIVSVIFTTTADLTAEFPARAARVLGWHTTPLLGAVEMDVAHAVPRCIRVLMHVNWTDPKRSATHVYLRDADQLRPDLR